VQPERPEHVLLDDDGDWLSSHAPVDISAKETELSALSERGADAAMNVWTGYFSFAYSALATMRMGMSGSGSASFQSVLKS